MAELTLRERLEISQQLVDHFDKLLDKLRGTPDTAVSKRRHCTIFIHVNRNRIASNMKHGTNHPVIAVRRTRRGKARYCQSVEILGPSRVIYDKCNPIACGSAQVWIETEAPVRMTGEEQP